LQSWCKQCRNARAAQPEQRQRKTEYDEQYREVNRERIQTRQRERWHADADFRENRKAYAQRPDVRDRLRAFDRQRNYVRNRRPEYKQAKLAYRARRRREDPQHRDALRAASRRVYLSNPERERQRSLMFSRTPAGKANQARANHRRRLREKQAPATLTAAEWQTILEQQGYRCPACGRPFSDALPPTRDHVIPVSQGGALTFDNCQALCRPCNSSKRTRDTDYRRRTEQAA
jgi:5-methylcytosine-specific restriction endonuclease McrA